MIGVVAGVGPYAGLDLLGKLLAETRADRDQDHLPVLSISQPSQITDRTAYLLGQSAENPGSAIGAQLLRLERMGATVAGVPCNTAHASPIWSEIERTLHEAGSRLQLINMIGETGKVLARLNGVQRVGVLSTTGTAQARVYPRLLEPAGFEVIDLDPGLQEQLVQPAIYDPVYGIKALGPRSPRARSNLQQGLLALKSAGAQAVILGCTEIPLVLTEASIEALPLIDATRVLARALIRVYAPDRLAAV